MAKWGKMINYSEITVDLLTEKHKNIISNFSCYEKDLVSFLVDDALLTQDRGISVTYLFLYESNLVGYISVLMDTLNLNTDLKDFFRSKGVTYKSIPAMKIGRLAVDDKYQRQGLGTQMISFSQHFAKKLSTETIGCRFLILDTKRNSDPKKDTIHFYKKLGFKVLKEREKGTIPLYLDLYLPTVY